MEENKDISAKCWFSSKIADTAKSISLKKPWTSGNFMKNVSLSSCSKKDTLVVHAKGDLEIWDSLEAKKNEEISATNLNGDEMVYHDKNDVHPSSECDEGKVSFDWMLSSEITSHFLFEPYEICSSLI